jgi:RimJ/RimL family protein N-acetyltransferase
MVSISVVPATEALADGFNRAVDLVARERRYIALTQSPPAEMSRMFLRAIQDGGGVMFVALAGNDEVVGWCDITRLPHEGFGHGGRLGMGVLPGFRRQGLGERLARRTIEAAWQAGFTRVELEVFSANTPAIHLYEKLGFIHEGRKRGARILDGRTDDVVLMALTRSSQ